ncbi:MAG: glutamate racemase [Spirochaetaceae bacterium]|jgi:glutamate racemase|nr:glutamate racemase [Spirochaetaceae bacterium]
MDRPVLFLDSGIGGLPYARHFLRHNPGERVVYTADRANFPYGPKDRAVLERLLVTLVGRLTAEFDPKLAVVACNAASVTALAALRAEFPGLPWVGTVPAVKPAVAASRTRHIGVLGTQRTVDDPYIGALAARFGADCAVSRIAAPDLVNFVENGGDTASPGEQRRVVEPYVEEFRRRGADGIVLGCTHFLFLLDCFTAATGNGIRIYHSVEGVSRRAAALLDAKGIRADRASPAPERGLLVLTGTAAPEARWETRAEAFGLTLHLLEGGKRP